jgi:Histidine kinase-, DNA gyrase B-, and HSP90-like ATPase
MNSPALKAAGESPSQPTFDLQISDPASLLNEVARRYGSSERILMEYIDNALDDSEILYRDNAEAYPFEVRIEIIIDRHQRYVTIRDNCCGMKRDDLERIVGKVGESKKRGITWVNGRFGFGVHAFRAAAESIRFRTKNKYDDHLELKLRRSQHRDIRRPWARPEPFPTDTETGTEVVVGPFDEEWFDSVTVATIKHEIESHFERLLARPNLTITVQEWGGEPAFCEPFAYEQIPGKDFRRDLEIEFNFALHLIEVHLKVAEAEVPGRAARFFSRGRRINEIAEIKSFIRKSTHRTSVWGHPNLLGYIEVGEIVRPIITRDDFDRGRGRTALYDAILTLEDEIRAAINQINEEQRDSSLNRLEDVLRDVLDDLAREDRLRLRSEPTPGAEQGKAVNGGGAEDGDEGGADGPPNETGGGAGGAGAGADTGPNPEDKGPLNGQNEGGEQINPDPNENQGAQRKRSGFDIQFGEYLPTLNGQLRRSWLLGGTIFINRAHPDFKDRLSYNRQGRARFTDRLGAYLAATVSIHYKDQFYARYGRQPERRDQMFDEQVAFQCRLESALRPHLATLEQEYIGEIREETDND